MTEIRKERKERKEYAHNTSATNKYSKGLYSYKVNHLRLPIAASSIEDAQTQIITNGLGNYTVAQTVRAETPSSYKALKENLTISNLIVEIDTLVNPYSINPNTGLSYRLNVDNSKIGSLVAEQTTNTNNNETLSPKERVDIINQYKPNPSKMEGWSLYPASYYKYNNTKANETNNFSKVYWALRALSVSLEKTGLINPNNWSEDLSLTDKIDSYAYELNDEACEIALQNIKTLKPVYKEMTVGTGKAKRTIKVLISTDDTPKEKAQLTVKKDFEYKTKDK